jgi:Mrp family chromosome partitioning ATPase
LSPGRIAEVLGELRARFDYVIVNAHPILTVAETSLVGRAADAVVLTVEKYESRLPLVSRAQEKIAAQAGRSVVLARPRDECLQ